MVISHNGVKNTYTVAVRRDEWSGVNWGLANIAASQAMMKFHSHCEEFKVGDTIKIESVERFKQKEINNLICELVDNVLHEIKNGTQDEFGG